MIGRSQRRRNGAGIVAAALVVGALAAGTAALTGHGPTLTASGAPAPAPAVTPAQASPEQPPGPPACDVMVADMDDRQRLAQRLMVGVDASDPAGAAQIVEDSQVGGIFIGGNDTALLRGGKLEDVQRAADAPLSVAVDDEGGRVQRIDDLVGDLPSARTMAQMSPQQVSDLARDRARKLRDIGITWNLAPTVDVSDQPSNAVIGDRSFADDPAKVTEYALAWAEGQEQGGVYGVLKHFPGHGHSSGDSHQGEVSVPPLSQLEKSDLLPYGDLIAPGKPLAGREGVMVGHLNVPGLTKDVPSSLEPATYQLLRDRYRFDGLVMTDDLGAMKAITDRFGLAESTTKALSAGADIALFSNVTPVAPLLDAAEKALKDGRIDRAQNDTAVARVLQAKGLCRR